MRRLVITETAAEAVVEQAEYYLQSSGQALVDKWISCVTKTLLLITRSPEIAARRTWYAAKLQGLRSIRIESFSKHLLFYFFDSHDDVVRVLFTLCTARVTWRASWARLLRVKTPRTIHWITKCNSSRASPEVGPRDRS